jgi:hypothetical protein
MKKILLGLAAFPIVGGSYDLWGPVRSDIRDFDWAEVGRLETAMWRSYYDHQPARLFMRLARTQRTQYHMPVLRSFVAALHGARAAVVFQRGRERSQNERALPDLVRFYRLVRSISNVAFDVDRDAKVELE